jgi:hypothetical protein
MNYAQKAVNIQPLNLFYEEPDTDRWIKYDRYPRKVFRNLFRGPAPVGGVKRWYLNLVHGLDILGYPYTINNYRSLKKGLQPWALVIGKPHLIETIPNSVNIIYGPAISSHPTERPFWFDKPNIKHILISCLWFKQMYDRDLPVPIPITVWPSGIDTDLWKPLETKSFTKTILIYDKIRWDWEKYNRELIVPITNTLKRCGIKIEYIQYGSYKEEQFRGLLGTVDAMIFLCEHETQGFAYLQTLSCNIPIMAWDRKGRWQDPAFYPDKVMFEPVTSVPYWDSRCGQKFKDIGEFNQLFELFWDQTINRNFEPRNYILDNLTLKDRSKQYIDIVTKIMKDHDTRANNFK